MAGWDLISVESTDEEFGFRVGPRVIKTHGPEMCEGRFCCVHNPSEHHMRGWPQLWRADSRIMERTCPHGIGHPDPDDVAYLKERYGSEYVGVHGCDGCCVP